MLKSYSTIEDTSSLKNKFSGLTYKLLGKTGLTVSACGFGSYRVDFRVQEHSDALEHALLNGINLIDTSANYSDGGSEVLIGNILEKLCNEKKIKREEIVVVSKGGYIQGKNFELAKKKKDEGNSYKEVTEYTENLWHCIHPDFLKDQITASLERMKLETVDVYLLHNPEYFLDSPVARLRNGQANELDLKELRVEYYRRIKSAFEYLEEEIHEGRIRHYGISSNSFVHNSESQTFTSLQICKEIANRVSERNHFSVIQFPLNLYETGAVKEKNQNGGTQTLLEYASQQNIGTIVNRPLNAILDKRLVRLADFEVDSQYTEMQEAQIIAEIQLLDSMENDFLENELPSVEMIDRNREAITAFLRGGKLVNENWKNFGTIESFNDLKKNFLIPRVNFAFTILLTSKDISEEAKDKLDKIARQINRVTLIIESIYGMMANERSKQIHDKLNSVLSEEEEWFTKLSLSAKSILTINSLDEISCTLVGMRQSNYVDEVLKCLKMENLSGAKKFFV